VAKLWFLSDPHAWHEKIIGYCDRPFANAQEMTEQLIERHNSVVRPQDHFYPLGDVAMKKPHLEWVSKLNGHGRLIGGNHDIFDVKDYLKAGYEKVMAMRIMDLPKGGNALFAHIPIHPASMGRFRAQIHGHIHNHIGYGFPYINVSAEVVNYTPVSFDELVAQIEKESPYELPVPVV
jgi:calcineurin-like phosphoesterase family protein